MNKRLEKAFLAFVMAFMLLAQSGSSVTAEVLDTEENTLAYTDDESGGEVTEEEISASTPSVQTVDETITESAEGMEGSSNTTDIAGNDDWEGTENQVGSGDDTVEDTVENTIVTETDDFETFMRATSELVKNNMPEIDLPEDDQSEPKRLLQNSESDEFCLKRLIVKGKGMPLSFEEYNATEVIKGSDDIYVVQFRTSEDARTAYEEIITLDTIQYVEPDTYVYAETSSGSAEDGDNISWGVSAIGADKYAEYLSYNQTEIKVAVVDSGVSMHPSLENRILSDGYDLVDNDDDPSDLFGHGTYVAGVVAACTPNLNVNILPVRVLNEDGGGSVLTIANGVKYAVHHGADVINLSLSAYHPRNEYGNIDDKTYYLDSCISEAYCSYKVVVAAAGNGNHEISKDCCPAHIKDVIVVGSVDSNLNRDYSYFGDTLDLVAPGKNIRSSAPSGGYENHSGTSLAAPHISAAVAMMFLDRKNVFYGAGITNVIAEHIEKVLKQTCTDLGDPGWDPYYGAGIPDLTKLIKGYSTPQIDTVSITLGEAIDLNFYLYIPKPIQAEDVKFVMDGPYGEEEYLLSEMEKDGQGRYQLSYEFKPIHGDRKVSLKLTDLEGNAFPMLGRDGEAVEGGVLEYGVYDYVHDFFNREGSELIVESNLNRALYAYVAYSVKWKYGTEVPEDTIPLPGLAESEFVNYSLKTEGVTEDVLGVSAALLLDSRTGLRLYFKMADDIRGHTVQLGAMILLPHKVAEGEYYVDIRDVGARDLKTAYTVTFDGSYSVTLSPMTYVHAALKSGEEDEDMLNLLRALCAYSDTADAYIRYMEQH